MTESDSEGQWIPTVCYMCYNNCGVKARLVDGVVAELKGDENNPYSMGRLCAKGTGAQIMLNVFHQFRSEGRVSA